MCTGEEAAKAAAPKAAPEAASSTPLTGVVARHYPMHYKVKKGQKYYWCSCGLSAKQPFCDGAHKGTNFRPVMFIAQEDKKCLMCMCKQTKNRPFCDMSHVKVASRRFGPMVLGVTLPVGGLAAYGAYKYFCSKAE